MRQLQSKFCFKSVFRFNQTYLVQSLRSSILLNSSAKMMTSKISTNVCVFATVYALGESYLYCVEDLKMNTFVTSQIYTHEAYKSSVLS